MTVSEPDRARRTLSGGILLFRWISFAWMATFNLVSSEVFRRPALAWTGIAVTGLWVLTLSLARGREGPVVLLADLALSSALILISGIVMSPGEVVGQRLFYATAYPLATALAWGARWGLLGALDASIVLGAALAGSRPLNGLSLGDLSHGQVLSLLNGMVNYLLAGGVAGLVSRHLDRSAEQLRSATAEAIRSSERAARLAERESLARSIHDSVLQALAYVHKRGREIATGPTASPAEVAQLAEMAAEQERALRALILREPEETPTGSASLRDALERLANETTGLAVTMSAVGPMWLPAHDVEEATAAVRQAVENVRRHAGAAHANVFAEVDDGWVVITVRDDGAGFVYDEERLRAEGKAGILKSMKGRIEDLGGRCVVTTGPGSGTEVELRLPARDVEANT